MPKKIKPPKERKHEAIVITDPGQRWYRLGYKIVKKHSNVLYPDEQSVTAYLKLCLKYGDACIQAITRERYAVEKRNTTKAQRAESKLIDEEE